VFLPTVAPPPPARLPEDLNAKPNAAARANHEAQMVLQGALRLPACGAFVARNLHAQLVELGTAVALQTFELLMKALCNMSRWVVLVTLATAKKGLGKVDGERPSTGPMQTV